MAAVDRDVEGYAFHRYYFERVQLYYERICIRMQRGGEVDAETLALFCDATGALCRSHTELLDEVQRKERVIRSILAFAHQDNRDLTALQDEVNELNDLLTTIQTAAAAATAESTDAESTDASTSQDKACQTEVSMSVSGRSASSSSSSTPFKGNTITKLPAESDDGYTYIILPAHGS